MVDAVREEDSSSQNVNIYITGIHTKEAFTEVSISTGASFFISDADFLAFPFRKGDEISSEVVESLERGHKLILCRSKALSLLDLAEPSTFMLRTKLRQRGFEPAVVEAVIAQLKEKNYLDDSRFARLWIASRLKRNPAGKSVLISGLRAKGVSVHDAEEAVSELLDEEALLEGARKVYNKAARKKNSTPDKIKAAMMQKGYSLSVIRQMTKEVLDGKETEED
ncbi:MAG: regulatory protein RecX [Spirochaetia bacterium]|nr:regulatory protein RecX [Spirochaetia bacterium]